MAAAVGLLGRFDRLRGSLAARAVESLWPSIMKKYGRPWSVVTDGLCSYPASMKEIGVADHQEVGRPLNNCAENSNGGTLDFSGVFGAGPA